MTQDRQLAQLRMFDGFDVGMLEVKFGGKVEIPLMTEGDLDLQGQMKLRRRFTVTIADRDGNATVFDAAITAKSHKVDDDTGRVIETVKLEIDAKALVLDEEV